MSKNKRLVLLKLGGSLITDKSRPFTARREVIAKLGREIKSGTAVIWNPNLIFNTPDEFEDALTDWRGCAVGIILQGVSFKDRPGNFEISAGQARSGSVKNLRQKLPVVRER